ncbi:MAG TPA: ABC transporter permease [Pyrinomonadaceae bacterium]|nr:ABC transporter permease [Pyrinomonadaceae bacterium]
MRTLFQDVRYALRVMRKRPGFTAAAVAALALGVGATTAVFSVVNSVLLRPLPYPDSERIVVIAETSAQNPSMFVSYPNFLDWRERARSFEALSTMRHQSFNLSGGDEPVRVDGRQVSAGFFAVYGVAPALGRPFLEEEDRRGAAPVAVLSHGLWERRFGGDASIVGRTIVLDNRPYTVVGVMPQGFRGAGASVDVLVPFGQFSHLPGWMGRDVRPGAQAVARLREGVTLDAARDELGAIAARLEAEHPQTNAGVGVRVESLYERTVGGVRGALYVLLGAVAFVLLIACANVANLLLAHAAARRKEFAVRAAMGASRWRVVRQLLTESVLLSLAGGAAGLLLTLWGVDLLAAAGAESIPRAAEIKVDVRVLLFTLGVSVLTGVVFGLAPALRSARAGWTEDLKEGGGKNAAGAPRRLSGALVVAETALALVLLVGAGLLVKSFARLLDVDPGFDASNVLTMSVPLPRTKYDGEAKVAGFYRQLVERVKGLPGVEAAAVGNELPLRGRGWPVDVEATDRPAPPPGQSVIADWAIVSPDYFRALGIGLLQGRALADTDTAEGQRAVVIDEDLARHFWPEGDAVGKQLRVVGPKPFEVVGVARRVRSYGLDEQARMRLYVPVAQTPTLMMNLAVRSSTSEPERLAKAVAAEVRAIDPDQPVYAVRTMEEALSESLAPRRLNATLLTVFAAVALALAAIGVYGVISYSVAQRTHEIGVRMALGAQGGDILRLVLRQGMLLALGGVAAGVLAALALTRVMTGLLFGVSATDPLTFAAVALVLTLVASLACLIPARRATKVDPMVALRYE